MKRNKKKIKGQASIEFMALFPMFILRISRNGPGSVGIRERRAEKGYRSSIRGSAVRGHRNSQDRGREARKKRDRIGVFEVHRIHFQRYGCAADLQSGKDRSRESFNKRICPGTRELGIYSL